MKNLRREHIRKYLAGDQTNKDIVWSWVTVLLHSIVALLFLVLALGCKANFNPAGPGCLFESVSEREGHNHPSQSEIMEISGAQTPVSVSYNQNTNKFHISGGN